MDGDRGGNGVYLSNFMFCTIQTLCTENVHFVRQ